MTWFGAIAGRIRALASALRAWLAAGLRRDRRPRIRYERVEELPDRLEPATLYAVGEEPHVWAAAMLCPCGCGDVIELNLLEQASPCWSVRQHRDGTVTLVPSVWRTQGCRSHFLIRDSRIDWCRSGAGSSAGQRRQ
jgi:hypothetical protein